MKSASLLPGIFAIFFGLTAAQTCIDLCEKSDDQSSIDQCKTGCGLFKRGPDVGMKEARLACENECTGKFGVQDPTEDYCRMGCDIKCALDCQKIERQKLEKADDLPSIIDSVFDSVFGPGAGLMMSNDIADLKLPKFVQDTVNGIVEQMSEDIAKGKVAGGEVVLINDGPGFHDETRLNIAPAGDKPLDDLMSEIDLLDEGTFSLDDDVVIESEADLLADVLPLLNQMESDLDDLSKDVDGPDLPETGLKQDPLLSSPRVVCSLHDMKIGQYVKCMRAAVDPVEGFLMAAFAVGLICLMGLCLIIPRRMKRTTGLVDSPIDGKSGKLKLHPKEAEALTVVTISEAKKVPLPDDLPPTYDDLTNLKVKLEPIHGLSASSEKQ